MTEPIHIVHPFLWDRLEGADHVAICNASGASYLEAEAAYLLPFLNETYKIAPRSRTIAMSSPQDGFIPSAELQVIVITYLLHAQQLPLGGKLVTPVDLKGGKSFFQGAHRLPLEPLIKRFGNDLGGFRSRGLSLGAKEVRFGDVGLCFPALPRVPVTMVLWGEDEEFPARLSCLFDVTVDRHLPLDAIYGLVTEICRRMLAEDGS